VMSVATMQQGLILRRPLMAKMLFTIFAIHHIPKILL
jgi:hypothetical protein